MINDQQILRQAGELAMDTARSLHKAVIKDPPAGTQATNAFAFEQIDSFIRGPMGVGWSWDEPYGGNHHGREWCGCFAARCWATAGLMLKPWRCSFFCSHRRLEAYGTYRDWITEHGRVSNPRPAVGDPIRLYCRLDATSKASMLLFVPQPGDILLVGDGRPPHPMGTHITLVEAWDEANRLFVTISGNGRGKLGDGTMGEGVVRANFHLGGEHEYSYCARRLIRPAITDLVQPP